MNRLVIIGNGFDLAHGLPTSYKDFIDDYWKMISEKLRTDYLYEDDFFKCEIRSLKTKFDRKELSIEDIKDLKSIKTLCLKFRDDIQHRFSNNFFAAINSSVEVYNWVDIENEYYYQLKIITKHTSLKLNEKKNKVKTLNLEFEQVKNRLEKYLKDKVVDSYNLELIQGSDLEQFKFCNILRPISIFNEELNLEQEFSVFDYEELKDDFETLTAENSKGFLRLLNFNYTGTALRYLRVQNLNDDLEKTHIAIHGRIGDDKEYKINFGFGDEMDDDYKIIENLDDNEYLKNFKSFQYLQNSNYKDLLDYVDSDKFQVLIMGHSCGLSDRTLLNTIFEHVNCRSIKVFFHETKDEKGIVIKDNYTEIIQNISRHFNKKKLMREKIVNKTLCQPLPQIQLPKKE